MGCGLASFVNRPNAGNHANCKFVYDRSVKNIFLKTITDIMGTKETPVELLVKYGKSYKTFNRSQNMENSTTS